MGNMKPREKVLFAITVAAMLLFAAWQFGLGSAFDAMGAGNSEIARLEKRFNDNLASLKDIYVVEREYRRVGQSPTSGDDQNLAPATAFNQEVFSIAENFKVQQLNIRTRAEEIRGVEDYELISSSLTFNTNHENTVKLLKAYEDAGVIFREVSLRSILDQDRIDCSIVVARIAEAQRRPTRQTVRPR